MAKKWSEEELEVIRKYKGQCGNSRLAKMLNCTAGQLLYAMDKFKIRRTQEEVDSLMEKITGKKQVRPPTDRAYGFHIHRILNPYRG